MQTLGVIDDVAATLPYAVAAASPLWIPDQEQALAGLRLPEHAGAAAEPSWEQILVAAGLDRESREWSPADRALADRLTDSRRENMGENPCRGWENRG